MALFNKKTTLVHHITYMGLMAAINVIFIVLATYIPLLMFLLILLLPFASTIVSFYCQKRYYIIYAIASVGLCLIFNISDTLFYVVPAVISGFAIGALLEKKAHPFWLILCSTVINAALTYAFIPLINLTSNTDIILSFLKAFKLEDYKYRKELVYAFIFIISLMQCSLAHYVLLTDARKIGVEINTRINCFAPYILGSSLSMVLALTFAFFYFPLAVVFLLISFYFGAFLLYYCLLSRNVWIYVLLGITLFASIILFAIFYKQLIRPFGIMLAVLFPLSISATSFIKNYLLKGPSNIE